MPYKRLHPIEILLVEDNSGDAFLMGEVLSESTIKNRLHTVINGEEALDFLYRRGRYADAPRPDIIFLDLNLPKKDGREVLAQMKSDADLKSIPVLVLTTSDAEEDVVTSYNLCANCYVTKPMGLDALYEVVKQIETFWFSTARIPARRGI